MCNTGELRVSSALLFCPFVRSSARAGLEPVTSGSIKEFGTSRRLWGRRARSVKGSVRGRVVVAQYSAHSAFP